MNFSWQAALAFGICGCCRSHELPVIRMQDIHRYDDMYYVIISADDTKTKKKNNEFAITGTFLDVVRRYEQLRPSHATTDRFFLNYQNGKCTSQTIGKNKFYKMPHRVAAFLQLPDVTLYTGNFSLTTLPQQSPHSSSPRAFDSPHIDDDFRKHRSVHRGIKTPYRSYIEHSLRIVH